MVNHRLGFSTQKLFAMSLHNKDLMSAFSDILHTLVSIPNVMRSLALHLVSGVVVIYLWILSREASKLKSKEEEKEMESHKLTAIFKLQGHVQVCYKIIIIYTCI